MTDTSNLAAKRVDPEASAPVVTTTEVRQKEGLDFPALKQRKGLYEFTIARKKNDRRGRVRRLLLHGGEFFMKPGDSIKRKFSLPAEVPTLRQLHDDDYVLSEGSQEEAPQAGEGVQLQGATQGQDGAPLPPVELADAFANPAEIAPQAGAQAQGWQMVPPTPEVPPPPSRTRKPAKAGE